MGLPQSGTSDYLNRVWHTLTLGAVQTPVILEFVRERVRLLALGSPDQ
jgi:hypothetical protein